MSVYFTEELIFSNIENIAIEYSHRINDLISNANGKNVCIMFKCEDGYIMHEVLECICNKYALLFGHDIDITQQVGDKSLFNVEQINQTNKTI